MCASRWTVGKERKKIRQFPSGAEVESLRWLLPHQPTEANTFCNPMNGLDKLIASTA
jgi:hypothetical protein